MQREIADLGDLRYQFASEATQVPVIVGTSALSTPNLNRFVRESNTCGRLQDLVHTGGAAPTFTAGAATASLPTGGAGPTFTCNAPSGRSGYALLANVATVIKPIPLRPAVPGGFTLDDFAISDDGSTVTCPAVMCGR